MIHSCVCLFSDSCSWVPCLSWTVKLSAVLQKNPSAPHSLVFQHFCIWTLSNNDCMILRSIFHTEDDWGTHMQLLQKIQTLTDAPKEKTCIKSRFAWISFVCVCVCVCVVCVVCVCAAEGKTAEVVITFLLQYFLHKNTISLFASKLFKSILLAIFLYLIVKFTINFSVSIVSKPFFSV